MRGRHIYIYPYTDIDISSREGGIDEIGIDRDRERDVCYYIMIK